jgi:2'-5' RNA ligase
VPRLRLGVVLLVPEPLAAEIDGLRRACGGPIERVPPHLTLVPPVNVRVDEVPEALRLLRTAASAVRPFTLRLGPPSTFLPATPTLHLAVGGRNDATVVLRALRDALFRPPFERPVTHPFVPHVTLADDVDPELVPGAVSALAGFVVEARFDRVHVLHEQRHGEAHRRWVPVADAPFAPPIVVGRGGVELDLSVTRLVDPECVAFETGAWPDDAPVVPAGDHPVGAVPLVVAARRRGAVVGVTRGWVLGGHGEIRSVLVAAGERGQGIARHLAAAFDHAARSADPEVGKRHDE